LIKHRFCDTNAFVLAAIVTFAVLTVACGGERNNDEAVDAVDMVATPSASPEPTTVLGPCATLLPLGERQAPDILRDVDVPGDREGVRALFAHLPREIDGLALRLPFVGPPEIFVARYGDSLVLNAKQLAPGETGLSAIERNVAASSASCVAGRDGDLVWATLSGSDHVRVIWGDADGSWSFGAIAPDTARVEHLLANFTAATEARQTPAAHTDTCTTTAASVAMVPDIASLAWASDQIVVGDVVRAHPTTPDPREPRLPLHTDFDILVESWVRGQPLDTLTIRQPGGEIPGGCADPMGQLELEPGDRFLLFLDHDERTEFAPAWFIVGERQGYWQLTNDDTFADLPGHYAAFERQPLASAIAAIRDALLGPMPASPIAGVAPVVPLDAAPLNPALGE